MRLLGTGILLTLTTMQVASAAGESVAPQVEQVSANVYVVTARQPAAANSGFVIGRDGVLVIDSGGSETEGRALRAAIADVTDLPVRWVVITHAHPEHAMGTAALRGPKTAVYSTAVARDEIEQARAGWVARAGRDTATPMTEAAVVVPNQLVESATDLNLGELRVVLLPQRPAHTPGDLVVWLPKQKILFAGDVVTIGRAPVLKDAHVSSWITALNDLESLGPARVVPGHGTVGSGVAITRQRDYLSDLWQLVRDGQAGGQNYVDIATRARSMIANRHAGHFPDTDNGLIENVKAVLAQLPVVKTQ